MTRRPTLTSTDQCQSCRGAGYRILEDRTGFRSPALCDDCTPQGPKPSKYRNQPTTIDGNVEAEFTLILPLLPLSWNKAMRMHFAVRAREFDAQKATVHGVWKKLADKPVPFQQPVEIEATAYFASRRFDADNLVWKAIIDSAKDLLLTNDSPVYVTRVISVSKTDKDNPRSEITFRPVDVVKLPQQNTKPRAAANSRGHVTKPGRV